MVSGRRGMGSTAMSTGRRSTGGIRSSRALVSGLRDWAAGLGKSSVFGRTLSGEVGRNTRRLRNTGSIGSAESGSPTGVC